ncbi:MAG: hypothetical protein CL608_15710 [Anaerolineaceae bacterium]|nr:hypothetical protein [Anaerolineaceae bacterium]
MDSLFALELIQLPLIRLLDFGDKEAFCCGDYTETTAVFPTPKPSTGSINEHFLPIILRKVDVSPRTKVTFNTAVS